MWEEARLAQSLQIAYNLRQVTSIALHGLLKVSAGIVYQCKDSGSGYAGVKTIRAKIEFLDCRFSSQWYMTRGSFDRSSHEKYTVCLRLLLLDAE